MIKIGDILYVKYSNKRVAVPVVIVAEVNTAGVDFIEPGCMDFDEDILEWYKDNAVLELSMSAIRNGIKSYAVADIPPSDKCKRIAEITEEPVYLYSEIYYLDDDTLDWGEMRGETYGALKGILEGMTVEMM